MFLRFIAVRGDSTRDRGHLATLKPYIPQYPIQPWSVSERNNLLDSLLQKMSMMMYVKCSQSLLKTESLHTYFSILLIRQMLLEGWLVAGVSWLSVKH